LETEKAIVGQAFSGQTAGFVGRPLTACTVAQVSFVFLAAGIEGVGRDAERRLGSREPDARRQSRADATILV